MLKKSLFSLLLLFVVSYIYAQDITVEEKQIDAVNNTHLITYNLDKIN
jgi:hypothetical protein